MKLLRTKSLAVAAALAGTALLGTSTPVHATVISSNAAPADILPTEIGARIRWGGTGQEAGILDTIGSGSATFTSYNLNPVGTPFWASNLNQDFNFAVVYAPVTGTLTLSIDFNRNGTFEAAQTEIVQQSTFQAPGPTSYAGYGFNYLHISGNGTVSTLTNLLINGQSFPNITPTGGTLDTYFDDPSSGPLAWNITGTLRFTAPGSSGEEPAWNFRFRNSELMPSTSQVPLPGSAALLLAGLGLGGLMTRRRLRQ